jgi:hypothetical protein
MEFRRIEEFNGLRRARRRYDHFSHESSQRAKLQKSWGVAGMGPLHPHAEDPDRARSMAHWWVVLNSKMRS